MSNLEGDVVRSLFTIKRSEDLTAGADDRRRKRKLSIVNRNLLIAAGEGDVKQVKSLLYPESEGSEGREATGKADLNFADEDGNTPICYAIHGGHVEVVRVLFERGAELFFENNDCKTPLQMTFMYSASCQDEIRDILMESLRSRVSRIIICSNKKEESAGSFSNSPSKEKTASELEISKRKKKIEYLLHRLKGITKGDFSYEHANTYIMFLEVFALTGDTDKKDFHNVIVNTRTDILKCNYGIDLEVMRNIIAICHNLDVENITDFFTCTLPSFLAGVCPELKMERCKKKFWSDIQKNMNRSEEHLHKLTKLVNQAYKNNLEEEELWFRFVVNIYPLLNLESEKNEKRLLKIGEIGEKLRHLRNELVHDFERGNCHHCRVTLIKLRTPIFKYYFANKIACKLTDVVKGTPITEIFEYCRSTMQTIVAELKGEGATSPADDEANGSVAYTVDMFSNTSLRKSVKEYFMCMCLVENLECDNKEIGVKNRYLDVDREELFERFITLKILCQDYGQDNEIYLQEKDNLMKKMEKMGVLTNKFEAVCKYYMDENTAKIGECESIIDRLVEFIQCLGSICTSGYDDEADIVSIGKVLLCADIFGKQLTLTKTTEQIQKLKNDYRTSLHTNKALEIVSTLNEQSITCGEENIEFDLKSMAQNMLETFNKAYDHELKFGMTIFHRKDFLNDLLALTKREMKSQDVCLRLTTIAQAAIEDSFMSPFAVVLIKDLHSSQKSLPDNSVNLFKAQQIEKLIECLLRAGRVKYLKDLLDVNFHQFNVHNILWDKVLERLMDDIRSISFLFSNINNLTKFAHFLQEKIKVSSFKERVLDVMFPFVEIVYNEAAQRIHSLATTEKFQEVNEILNLGDKLEKATSHCSSQSSNMFLGMVLKVDFENERKSHKEALNIIELCSLENFSPTPSQRFLMYDRKAETLAEVNDHAKSAELYKRLLQDVMNYLLKNDHGQSVRVDHSFQLQYSQMNDISVYHELLTSSTILESHTRLRVEVIAMKFVSQIKAKSDLDIDTIELTSAVQLLSDVYWCLKVKKKAKNSVLHTLSNNIGTLYRDIGLKGGHTVASLYLHYLHLEKLYMIMDDRQKNTEPTSDNLKSLFMCCYQVMGTIGRVLQSLGRFERATEVLSATKEMGELLNDDENSSQNAMVLLKCQIAERHLKAAYDRVDGLRQSLTSREFDQFMARRTWHFSSKTRP